MLKLVFLVKARSGVSRAHLADDGFGRLADSATWMAGRERRIV